LPSKSSAGVETASKQINLCYKMTSEDPLVSIYPNEHGATRPTELTK
jgi:hypothetical protein